MTDQKPDELDEAALSVLGWGAYASEYFQKKHDLEGDVRKIRQAREKFLGEPKSS